MTAIVSGVATQLDADGEVSPTIIYTKVYRMPSETVAGQTYNVAVAQGIAICDCQGYRSHGHCKHERKVIEMESQNGAAVADAPVDDAETRAIVPIKVKLPTTILPSKAEMSIMAALSKGLRLAAGVAIPKQLDTAGKVLAVVQAGWEMGVRPMTAMRHISIINGKTEPDAQLMAGIVMAAEPDARFLIIDSTQERALVRFVRPARGSDFEMEYTIADATKAGLLSKDGPWKQYPKDMLRWAVIKRLCRLHASDLINAVTPLRVAEAAAYLDELEEETGETIDAEYDELYNEGDDAPVLTVPEETAARPEYTARVPSVREKIGIFMRELKDTLAPVDFARVIQGVQLDYPGKFTKDGATILGKSSDEECAAMYAGLLNLRPSQKDAGTPALPGLEA